MRSSSTHYGKGWTFVVCELETDSWEWNSRVCVWSLRFRRAAQRLVPKP